MRSRGEVEGSNWSERISGRQAEVVVEQYFSSARGNMLAI